MERVNDMKKLMAIGEALIDFIPEETGKPIKEVCGFQPAVGGAPANVCGAFSKLGGNASMITQLGKDPFGDKIIEEFEKYNIDCSYIQRTGKANTALAFVALKEDGNREFSFYRNPSADMLLDAKVLQKEWFSDAYALHFCSVALSSQPMKEAHEAAIAYTLENQGLISFDPNLRLALWEDLDQLRNVILEFLPKAHILKISDEELEFITGKTKMEEALPQLFVGNVQLILYTQGAAGASAYTKEQNAFSASKPVKAVDTTGAGDAFIGSFLYQLWENGVDEKTLGALSKEQLEQFLAFSNQYCGASVQKAGAIASYPEKLQL